MWGKIIIPMYRLRLNGLYGLYGPRCPLFSKRPINLISLSLSLGAYTKRSLNLKFLYHIKKFVWKNTMFGVCYNVNYANPVYGVATICHQVRWLRWGHPSLFHTATSLLIWYKMFCVRDISYRLIRIEFINMFSVYAKSGTHSRINWQIIVVLTYNPSVLMCVEITDAPKL